MRLAIQVAAMSDVGVVRSNNEDSFGHDIRHGIFVVCDGMGGQAAGELASKMAVETVLSHFARVPSSSGIHVFGRKVESVSRQANKLATAIQLANRSIYEAASRNVEQRGMGCTIVAVCVQGDRYSTANVGDSRIYLIRGDSIQQLTNDHSLVMEQVRRGLMTTEEAEHSTLQSVIVRALGADETVEPDLEDRKLLSGDVLLLCSDGLSRFVKESAMLDLIGHEPELANACRELIALAKAGGSDDNITCMLLRAVEPSWAERLAGRLTGRS